MKNSIDLTENRDFNTRNLRKKKMREVLNDFSYDKFSNDLISRHQSTIEPYLSDKGAIYQGNKNERRSKKFADSFSDGICCDCCGRDIYPYYHDTLCNDCLMTMEYRSELQKIFWLERRM